MPLDILISLFALAMTAAWTPGPNNAMLASAGATFGFRACVPHIMGIGIGFPLMIFCIAMGLGQVFEASPLLQTILRWASAVVILWFAWKTATASGPSKEGGGRPLTFLQAAGFQWINPKAWVMAIAVTSQFVTGQDSTRLAIIVSLVFMAAGFSSASGWTWFGTALQHWLKTPARLMWFNRTMAMLLVLSFLMILLGT